MKDVVKKIAYCILVLIFIVVVYSRFDYYIFNTLETTLEFNSTISNNIARFLILIIPLIIVLISIYLKKIKKTKLAIALCIFAIVTEVIISLLVCNILNSYVTEANDYNSKITNKLEILYIKDLISKTGEQYVYYTSNIVDFLDSIVVSNEENKNQVTIIYEDNYTYLSKTITKEYTTSDELNELIDELKKDENTYYKVEQEYRNQYISSFKVTPISEDYVNRFIN